MNTKPLVGRMVRRRPCGITARITDEKTDRVRIKDVFWHGWVTRVRFERDWELVEAGGASNIRVFPAKREEEGSCNGCQRRDESTVYVVQTRAISIRLCPDCAGTVVAGLRAARSERGLQS